MAQSEAKKLLPRPLEVTLALIGGVTIVVTALKTVFSADAWKGIVWAHVGWATLGGVVVGSILIAVAFWRRSKRVEAEVRTLDERAKAETERAAGFMRRNNVVEQGLQQLMNGWSAKEALYVHQESGTADFVQLYDDQVRVLCLLRILNCAPFDVTLIHAELTWEVRFALTGEPSLHGSYDKPVARPPLKAGQLQEPLEIGDRNLAAKREATGGPAMLCVKGRLLVTSELWQGPQSVSVDSVIWVNIGDKRSRERSSASG